MYISITGLKPKGFWSTLKFWTLAIPTFKQASTAKGNKYCQVRRIEGYQCTLTAWDDRESMLVFLHEGPHLKAMKAFHRIATGKTYGFESDVVPTWENAFVLLQEMGKNY
jgi:hypothetical protein